VVGEARSSSTWRLTNRGSAERSRIPHLTRFSSVVISRDDRVEKLAFILMGKSMRGLCPDMNLHTLRPRFF